MSVSTIATPATPVRIDCTAAPEPRALRQAMGRFATGVAIITTRTRTGELEGMTVNSFSSVSLDPPLVLWSLRRQARALTGFVDAGCFAVNILSATQGALSRHFATPMADRFESLAWEPGHGGCPLLPGCLASFECDTHEVVGAGDHLILIGRIRHVTHRDGAPLVFHGGQYGVPVALTA
ncbi:flavin reductase family protein [Roseomonas hellenica]|uniref:Flavin reductase family protein n=1 Tax=Plastoroseomonas hellenica TaxID=2687306 RepID=A0ABS5F079_9PROT|nr:flavin reductase family protein [Plastoroseomonas hellenica]MBR0665961.1 flavin reductase family protein [Plastoroseomonas hellenica]